MISIPTWQYNTVTKILETLKAETLDDALRTVTQISTAIEAAGLDPATATVEDLIAWIKSKQRRFAKFTETGIEWTDNPKAPKLEDLAVLINNTSKEVRRKFDEVYQAVGVGVYEDLLAWIRERRAEDWQDISTAPKDGTMVDLWCDGKRYPNCSVHENFWMGITDSIRQPPTHWRPIPKGPKV